MDGLREKEAAASSQEGAEDSQQDTEQQKIIDRVQAITGLSEKNAAAMVRNWQKLVGVVVIILLGVLIFSEFRSVREKKQMEAAYRFSEVQKLYASILSSSSESEQEKEALSKKRDALRDMLRVLAESYSGTVYGKLSSLYIGIADYTGNELASAGDPLKSFFDKPAPLGAELGEEIFLSELASLLSNRVLLSGNEEQFKQAKVALLELSKNASFINTEALLILARLAESQEEKASILKAAQDLRAARPEFGEQLVRELQAYGFDLNSTVE